MHKLETNEKIENFSKEIKDIKETQMEILEQKNAISEINISVDGLNGRMEATEEGGNH